MLASNPGSCFLCACVYSWLNNNTWSHSYSALAADSFAPNTHGLAEEYQRVLKDGYSSIRDAAPQREPPLKKVVVVGWCGDIQDLVDSLNMFATGRTVVTVLCDCCPEVSFRPRQGCIMYALVTSNFALALCSTVCCAELLLDQLTCSRKSTDL